MDFRDWAILAGFVVQIVAGMFSLGRIYQKIDATQKDVVSLKKSYAKDHQVMVRLVTEHGMNHDSHIVAPEPNGNGG